jgi:CDP-paratose 2-epimerase
MNTLPAAPEGAPVLVTGGAGFIGGNLVDRIAREGRRVIVFDDLSREGTERNVEWLLARHGGRVEIRRSDIRDAPALEAAVAEAGAVFHFAAQVAVTTSMQEPRLDFSVNLAGTFGLLDALRRRNPDAPLIFASTNKVYGNLDDVQLASDEDAYFPVDPALRATGISEQRRLAFCTPYGCSKGAADQYVLDYAHSFGLSTAVLRMSCIYGHRQMGTEDQGWVAHFVIRALRGEPITIFGDGRQVRDILYVDDAVDAYLGAWRRISGVRGRAFNLGGGPANAVSLKSLLAFIEERLGRPVKVVYRDWRPGDQRYYVSDASLVRAELGLHDPLPWREGVARLIDWLRSEGARAAESAARAEAAE